jgi:hypothetical protein
MRVLLWGLGVPTLVLLVQILWWRLHRPTKSTRLLISLLVSSLAVFAVACLLPVLRQALFLPHGLLELCYVLALAAAVSTLYLITYCTIDAKSPSTLIVLAAQRSRTGITFEQACDLFSNEEFIVERVEALVQARQLCLRDDALFLTWRGRIFLEAFLLPRRIMGLQHWGG